MRITITETTWAEKDGVEIEGSRAEAETVWEDPPGGKGKVVTGWSHRHPDPERARRGQMEQTRVRVTVTED